MSFYGHYRSTTSSQTGCPKEFTTLPRDEIRFPPQVQYLCTSCGKEHGFRYARAIQVTTPIQHQKFKEMCDKSGIEMDVEVP